MESAVCDVDSCSLTLWKASILVNNGFKETVRNMELRDEEALSSVEELLDIFSTVPCLFESMLKSLCVLKIRMSVRGNLLSH